MRPQLHEVLGDLAHARIAMRVLKGSIIIEMEQGYRPTYRGHEWGRHHFDALEAADLCVEMAFGLMKALQFPEMAHSRLTDIRELVTRVEQINVPAIQSGSPEARRAQR